MRPRQKIACASANSPPIRSRVPPKSLQPLPSDLEERRAFRSRSLRFCVSSASSWRISCSRPRSHVSWETGEGIILRSCCLAREEQRRVARQTWSQRQESIGSDAIGTGHTTTRRRPHVWGEACVPAYRCSARNKKMSTCVLTTCLKIGQRGWLVFVAGSLERICIVYGLSWFFYFFFFGSLVSTTRCHVGYLLFFS